MYTTHILYTFSTLLLEISPQIFGFGLGVFNLQKKKTYSNIHSHQYSGFLVESFRSKHSLLYFIHFHLPFILPHTHFPCA